MILLFEFSPPFRMKPKLEKFRFGTRLIWLWFSFAIFPRLDINQLMKAYRKAGKDEFVSLLNIQLDTIIGELQSWIDWAKRDCDSCGAPFGDSTRIINPPVWPSVGVLKNWIKILKSIER